MFFLEELTMNKPQDDHIALSDPDIGHHELATVLRSLGAPRLSGGPLVEDFEAAFARLGLAAAMRWPWPAARSAPGSRLRALGIGAW